MWCSVLQCVVVRCSNLQCVAVCCSVLQCLAVCCSVLQCGAYKRGDIRGEWIQDTEVVVRVGGVWVSNLCA